MAPVDTALTSKGPSESPYQLDKTQVYFPTYVVCEPLEVEHVQTLKASTALLKHIQSEAKRKEAASATRNLLAAGSDSSDDASGATNEPVWLCFTTKVYESLAVLWAQE